MSDYISREETLERLCKSVCNVSDCKCDEARCPEWYVIHDIPAADVRPVVLCRDCKYWELSKIEPPFRVCTYVCGATFVRSSEDFCSRGSKREES